MKVRGLVMVSCRVEKQDRRARGEKRRRDAVSQNHAKLVIDTIDAQLANRDRSIGFAVPRLTPYENSRDAPFETIKHFKVTADDN